MENIDETRAKLSKYLYSMTRYKETYEEIFDHVLKVIELEEQPFSEHSACHIIDQDFGGLRGIDNMEQEATFIAKRKVSIVYWQEFTNHFTKLNLLYTLANFGFWFFVWKTDVKDHSILFPGYAPIIFIWASIIVYLGLHKLFDLRTKKSPSIFKQFVFENCIKNNSFIVASSTTILILNYFSLLSPLILSVTAAVLITLTSINVRIFSKLNGKNTHLKTA